MTQAKYLFRKLQHAIGQDTLTAERAVISTIQTEPRTAVTAAELGTLTQQLGLPVIDKSEEEMERAWYLHRGQKLVRQENWTQLSVEIQQFDEMRALTSGGIPISELLTRGARGDIVQPIRKSLENRDTSPKTEGLSAYQAIADANPKDYGIAMIVAYTHMDAAWVWQHYSPQPDAEISLNAQHRHFKIARALLDPFDANRLNAPALAAAKCAALPAQEKPKISLTKLYETLVSLDPKTAQYLRSFGVNLLPGRFGSYEMLNAWALKALEHTRTLWGTGAYAWVYLDALRQDAGAFGVLDLNLFMEALIDILDRCGDQHTANLLAAFTAVTLVQPAPGYESLFGRRKRLQLNEAADWIIETQLREIHPLVWADALPRSLGIPGDLGTEARKDLGRETAVRILAHRHSKSGH